MLLKINANQSSRTFIWIIIVLVAFLSLFRKATHDLQEWDESRNGVNAIEMIQNKDYVNLHFNGAPDTWNVKPPLMIWCIAAAYKIFGFNEFALRFPTTLSIIVFFILCFYTIRILEGPLTAFLTCLLLISCKAIFGIHVGLTGDFDAMLILFLTASVYAFILYVEKQRKYAIVLAALFTGLAFYSKGTASLVLLPGFILYTIVRRKIRMFKCRHFLLAVLLFLLIASSWLLLVNRYGKTYSTSFYKSEGSVETMFVHDTYRRLMSSDFEYSEKNPRDYLFFFEVLDSKFNLWNYLFYPGLCIGIWALYRHRKSAFEFINAPPNRLPLLSICLILPLSLTLSFATNKNHWYLAPLYPYVAFIIVKTVLFIGKKWQSVYIVVALLFAFTLFRQVHYMYSLPDKMHQKLTKNEKLVNKRVVVVNVISQDLLLYFKWLNMKIEFGKNDLEPSQDFDGKLIFAEKAYIDTAFKSGFTTLESFDAFDVGLISENRAKNNQ